MRRERVQLWRPDHQTKNSMRKLVGLRVQFPEICHYFDRLRSNNLVFYSRYLPYIALVSAYFICVRVFIFSIFGGQETPNRSGVRQKICAGGGDEQRRRRDNYCRGGVALASFGATITHYSSKGPLAYGLASAFAWAVGHPRRSFVVERAN